MDAMPFSPATPATPWRELAALAESFLRMWRFYFAYCTAGFAERHVSVVQVVLARSQWRGDLTLRPS